MSRHHKVQLPYGRSQEQDTGGCGSGRAMTSLARAYPTAPSKGAGTGQGRGPGPAQNFMTAQQGHSDEAGQESLPLKD